MKENIYFITGTDTEVGKTYVSCKMLEYFTKQGYQAVGFKPVASDAKYQGNVLVNQDALNLHKASSINLDLAVVNPVVFQAPIAPHIAAKKNGTSLSVNLLTNHYVNFLSKVKSNAVTNEPLLILVEGAGGWLVPLNDEEDLSDFVREINIPIILVVAIKLGCINHAMLTVNSIQAKGLTLAGWIANVVEDNVVGEEIIQTLQDRIASPMICKVMEGGVINSSSINLSY